MWNHAFREDLLSRLVFSEHFCLSILLEGIKLRHYARTYALTLSLSVTSEFQFIFLVTLLCAEINLRSINQHNKMKNKIKRTYFRERALFNICHGSLLWRNTCSKLTIETSDTWSSFLRHSQRVAMANKYLLKLNNRNIREMCDKFYLLTIFARSPIWHCQSGAFFVNFEHILNLLLTLLCWLWTGKC